MSMTPKESVQQMIRRKMARTKKIKEDQGLRSNPKELILLFLTEFDTKFCAAKTDIEKYFLVDSESRTLLNKLKFLDEFVGIELIWYGENTSDMRLEGVRVTWGDSYRIANRLSSEQTFDVSSVFFE